MLRRTSLAIATIAVSITALLGSGAAVAETPNSSDHSMCC